MEISDIIALGSLLVAVVALIKSFLSDRKVKAMDLLLKKRELNKANLEDDEIRKADVEVNVVETPKGSSNKLRFYNKGKSPAYNINFKITSNEGIDAITLHMQQDYLPYPKLLPQQNFDIYFNNFGDTPHQTILITWDDDYGKERSKEVIVDM
ncbi:hypothetical protein [Prevotella corporis]|uniref:hypothetical protein n=1 Tax=Prevotella corporis TaxID=28128 RepID=UPI002366F5FA|nr:hypothetical protein [Prevotella corporis]